MNDLPRIDFREVIGYPPKTVGWVSLEGPHTQECMYCHEVVTATRHEHVLKPVFRNGQFITYRPGRLPA